jgi:hypothetical protein
MNPSLVAQMEAAASGPAMDFSIAIVNMGHAALLGAALMLMTVWATYQTVAPAASSAADSKDEGEETPADLILASANVLFLCFGMTAVMLLVNNNLARAFAIGAAIALVRFRIKVNSKALSMGLFYGVLTGMACGVGQVYIGYTIVVFFALLQLVVLGLVKMTTKKPAQQLQSAESKSNANSNAVVAAAITMKQPLPAAPATTQDLTQDI